MHELPLLRDLVILFALAAAIVLLFSRLKLPAAVGFLLSGVLAGPQGFGLISGDKEVKELAEIGVILLLFTIGIEFSIERLLRLGKAMVLGGGVQVLLTGALAAGIAGAAFGSPAPQAVFIGMLVALSSTAIVLKLLVESAELESPQGRMALAILLFQDLCVVPMMIAVPLLAGEGLGAGRIAATLGRAAAVLFAAVILGRYIVPRLLVLVVATRSRELFLLTLVVLCLAAAWVSNLAGLSLALGAFLAGLVVSQSEYSHQALSDFVPFRDVFNSVFLISIGMLLDLSIFREPALLLAGVGGLIILKSAVGAAGVLATGYSVKVAVLAGLYLAQVGEFSFVLVRSAEGTGLLDPTLERVFIASAVVTMGLTPFLKQAAPRLAQVAERVAGRFFQRRPSPIGEETPSADLRDHVIILGFGWIGRSLARVLKETGIPYVVVELNPETVRRERARGEPILFGDASRPEILKEAGIETARVLVIAVSDPTAARAATQLARRLNPRLTIIVRTRFLGEVESLRALGADEVIPEEFETSLEIFSRTLRRFGIGPEERTRIIRKAREDTYGALRGGFEELPPQERVL